MSEHNKAVAVVIPCYKVTRHIMDVIAAIPPLVSRIYVVDDCCPDKSGAFVQENNRDPRVVVLFNEKNKGVGGAVMAGYRAAIADQMLIAVKVDGDGQMDPALIPEFIEPILHGEADYTKGNRFFNLEEIHQMPKVRVFGNAVLSLLNKLSSGYWDIFDPTNGYTAIHVDVLKKMSFAKISERYFFESDMLFRLNTLRAKVVDIPMDAHYGDEESQLKIGKIIGDFTKKNIRNTCKRIFYNYFLRDMSVASIELVLGLFLLVFGLIYGSYHWAASAQAGTTTPTGTVMLAVLPIVIGVQLLLSFLSYDIENVPRRPIHRRR
ncbi:glycosyltransferase family 2 protein [Cellvibrio fontiphilus]|uniref:Glycosyltransferase family 2 protein n=1 Tax=Cellvibrio fontiphilus TaxID=1815559 RepID=A0ABV7FBN2_9GAMM